MKNNPNMVYWDENGEICCGIHAPYRGSDTWVSGRWEAVSPDDVQAAFAQGMVIKCECCGKKASAIYTEA